MKTKILSLSCFAFAILCAIFSCFVLPTFSTYADNEVYVSETISDSAFSMTMMVDGRKNSTIPKQTKTVQNDAGDVTYYVFQWKDLEDLHFRFQSQISYSSRAYSSYEFLVSHKSHESDTLKIESLYHGNIASNNFSQFDFYYYIDSTSKITENATRCKGNDFGYYKFDFNYTYIEDEQSHTISIGEFYVQVVPQDIDTVPETELKLLYSVTSSNKLMNVFNIYLSNDSYKYVDPAYLQWNVVGKDKLNVSYVLSKEIQESNLSEYANYRVLYENPLTPIGTSFIFDSNDVEGTWTVILTIKSNTSHDKTLSVSGLSTIKEQKASFLWIIILAVAVVLVAIVVIILIVLKKKHDKIW